MKNITRSLCLLLVCSLLLGVVPVFAATQSEKESNDSLSLAQPIVPGDTIDGAIGAEGDIDFYSFSLSAGGELTLHVGVDMEYYSLLLFNAESNIIWYDDYNSSNGAASSRTDDYSLFLSPGTYYLEVRGSTWRNDPSRYTGSYTIATAFTSANATEVELNNSLEQANAIELGDEIRGMIALTDDYDFYRFTLTEGGCVNLDMTSYMEYFSLLLHNEDGTVIWYEDYNQRDSRVGFGSGSYPLYLSPGTYYLQVRGCIWKDDPSKYPGTYQLKTGFVSANATEVELNDSLEQANAIELGDEIRGMIALDDDFDFYRFTLTEGGCVNLDMTSYMEYFSLLLHNEDGTVIWYEDYNQRDSRVGFGSGSYPLYLSPGTYYLQVRGCIWKNDPSKYPGTYQLKTGFVSANATEVEPNNSIAQANAIAFKSEQRGMIDLTGDVDFYQFTMPTDGKLLLQMTSYMEYYSLLLYNAQGSLVWSDDYNHWNQAEGFLRESHVQELSAGSYYVQVRGCTWKNDPSKYPGFYTLYVGVPDEACTGGDECPSRAFTDMPGAKEWSHKGIDFCVKNKLMNGITGTAFKPNDSLTRAQLVTILYRMAGSPAVSTNGTFTDVKAGLWYSNAIEWAAANSIVNGVGNNRFDPDGKITREQIAAILYRSKSSPAVSGSLSGFPDNKTVSGYAVNALVWATEQKLINGIAGTGGTLLAPRNNATRAQIAAIIMRFVETES